MHKALWILAVSAFLLCHARPAWCGNDELSRVLIQRLLARDVPGFMALRPPGSEPASDIGISMSALDVASVINDPTLVESLMDAGFTPKADPEAVGFAVQVGAIETLQTIFRKYPPSPGQAEELSGQAAHYINRSGMFNLLQAVADGADPSLSSDPWTSVLQRATDLSSDHIRMLGLLHNHGATFEEAAIEGRSFLEVALDSGEAILVYEALRLRGKAQSFDVAGALKFALENENDPAVLFLLGKFPGAFSDQQKIAIIMEREISPTLFVSLTEGMRALSIPEGRAQILMTRFVEQNSAPAIERLVTFGVSAETGIAPPLRIAIENGSFSAAEMLLNLGARANYVDALGQGHAHGLWHVRERPGIAKTLKLVVAAGLAVDRPDNTGRTALDYFAQTDRFPSEVLEVLATTESAANAAAFVAIEAINEPFLRWLLDVRRVSPKIADTATGKTLLETAITRNSLHVTQTVFSRIDNPASEIKVVGINNALARLIKMDCMDCFDALLPAATSLNAPTEFGPPLLFIAADALKIQYTRKLLSNGAMPDAGEELERAVDLICAVRPRAGRPPEVEEFRRELISELLDQGASLRTVSYGKTSLLSKCLTNRRFDSEFFEVLYILVGSEISHEDVRTSVVGGAMEALIWMGSKGARFDTLDDQGNSLLTLAVERTNIDAASFLLQSAPSILNKRNARGATPLEDAFRLRHAPIARMLVSAGAALPDLDELSRTAYGTALENNELAEVLLTRVLSAQIVSELANTPAKRKLLMDGFAETSRQRMPIPVFNFGANDPWRPFDAVQAREGGPWDLTQKFEGLHPLYNQFGLRIFHRVEPAQISAIVQSIAQHPFRMCLPVNQCYEGHCGYCSEYRFVFSTTISIPACQFSQSQPTCFPEVLVAHDGGSTSTIQVSQGGGPMRLVSPGDEVEFDRSLGSLEIKIGPDEAPFFYSSFSLTMHSSNETLDSFGIRPTERLAHYWRARVLASRVADGKKSDLAAFVKVGAELSSSNYKDVAEEDFRKSMEIITAVPAVFDDLLDLFEKIDTITFESLPVVADRADLLARYGPFDPNAREEIADLAAQLKNAHSLSVEARVQVTALRDRLLALHSLIGNRVRLALLEYLQYDSLSNLHHFRKLDSSTKARALQRLRRHPLEVLSPEQRQADQRLEAYFQ